jgi:sterol desaturase/sphingolipid hydroxylase (fatty acid hydroxylase superfamily)
MSIRLGLFLGVFGVMAVWELIAPRRLSTLLLRLLFPAAAVGIALLGEARGWGLFDSLALPWAAVLGGVIALDLAIYLQHVLFHAVPALWRLHRMHHADLDFDVTTGGRFHPIEILLSILIKFTVIAALGAPALTVLIFEVLLNITSLFNHSNIRIPLKLDRALRWFVVTPDMHRVHHSVESNEINSNFGFNPPWWDWLLGTYRDQPRAGHAGMSIGILTFRDPKLCSALFGMLIIPFIEPQNPITADELYRRLNEGLALPRPA